MVGSVGLVTTTGCGTAQESDPPPRVPVVESARFRFYSDPDINLHHMLYHWSRAENGEALTRVQEMDDLGALSDDERAVWEASVAAYWRNAGTRNLLFDDDLVALRARIANRQDAQGLPDRDVRLYEALQSARPVYQAHWAEAHQSVNLSWLDGLMVDLPTVEDRSRRGDHRRLCRRMAFGPGYGRCEPLHEPGWGIYDLGLPRPDFQYGLGERDAAGLGDPVPRGFPWALAGGRCARNAEDRVR